MLSSLQNRKLHILHTTLFMDTPITSGRAKEKGHPLGCPYRIYAMPKALQMYCA